MGTNRRYADHYDRLMTQRIAEVLIRPKPLSLSPAELDTDNDEVTTPATPVSVRAWARYPETPARVEGRAIAWTSRAVHVEWVDGNGETQRAWVWSSAVEKI
jgi:hypothetical protein